MKVKNDLADIGVIAPNDKVRIEWEIEDGVDPEDFIHFAPDCGCTANVRTEGNLIVADFTETDSKQLMKDDKIKKWYPTGRMPITKGIWAYFADEYDLYVYDEKSRTNKLNPDKPKFKLTFIGQVAYEQETAE